MRAFGALVAAAILAGGTGASAASPTDFMAKNYPPTALKKGEEGRVGFRVNLSAEGRIEQCEITATSGYPTLDRETCDFIVQFAKFPPVRGTDGKAQRATNTGFITWKLPPGVKKTAAAPNPAASLPAPLLCRRTEATGTTIGKLTQCMTAAEWKLHEALTMQKLEDAIARRVCSDHGC